MAIGEFFFFFFVFWLDQARVIKSRDGFDQFVQKLLH